MKTIQKEEGYPLSLQKTYFAMIQGSVHSSQYRKLFVEREDGSYDVINDGDLACAFFVSSILHLFGLIDNGVHTTVNETLLDMEASDWIEVKNPERGAVAVWGLKLSDTDGQKHRHIGFCVSKVLAVSTNAKLRSPQIHRINGLLTERGEERAVQAYYMHPLLMRVG